MTDPRASSPGAIWTATDLDRSPHDAPDKAARVQAMFAAIAGAYDLNNRLHSLGRDQAWRRTAVRLCDVQPTDRVLDVACGTGDLAEAFADAGPSEVLGVDFTAAMLDVARNKAAKRRRAQSVPIPRYEVGDAMDLAFDDGRFDVASIAFGIRNVDEPARALAEFCRVLAPGGRLVILEFSEPTNPVLRWLSRVWCRRIMPVTATLIARDRTGAYRYLPRSVDTFLDRQAMAQAMERAGFERVQQRVLTFGICVAYLGHVPA